MSGQNPRAKALKADADKIIHTFSKCEKICLDVGIQLGDAIPGLSEIGGLFETLSHSIDSADFRAANSDLQAVASDISAIGHELTGESEGLVSLVALNKKIAARIENVASNIRTIVALVFNVKIEAASLVASSDNNMMDFAQGLQFLAMKAQRAIEEYQSTHAKLYDLLQSTSSAQMSFLKSHQHRLISITSEITTSLNVIIQRRHEIAGASAEIGIQSQRIGLNIGQGVVALQVGDSTRQRVEHVHQALHHAAELLEAALASPVAAHMDEQVLDEKDAPVAAAICRLQSLQLNAALGDFDTEMNTIGALLQNLVDDSIKLSSRGQALSGSGEGGQDSFLEELEKKLKSVNALVQETYRARVIVDRATSAVEETITNMDVQTARLSEIVVDMTMLGMNAVLKSTRLGQNGKGLNVIALELRNYAVEVVQGIKALKPAIDEIMGIIKQLSDARQTHNAEYMMQLEGRMNGAIDVFRFSGQQMQEASAQLQTVSQNIGNVLRHAVAQLDSRHDISDTLLEAIVSIDRFAEEIHDRREISSQNAAYIDDMLYGNYTMECERQTHNRFVHV